MAKVIGVKLPDDKAEQFDRAATAAGFKTTSAWLRELAEREVAPPPIEPPTQVKITQTHDAGVLEHAARAEAPIGRSVTEFLMANHPKVAPAPEPAALGLLAPVDEWETKCTAEFGRKVLADASKYIPRWDRLSWEQRHEALTAKKEAAEW